MKVNEAKKNVFYDSNCQNRSFAAPHPRADQPSAICPRSAKFAGEGPPVKPGSNQKPGHSQSNYRGGSNLVKPGQTKKTGLTVVDPKTLFNRSVSEFGVRVFRLFRGSKPTHHSITPSPQ